MKMEIRTWLEQLFASGHPGVKLNSPASPEAIAAAEAASGVHLPPDYVEFLRRSNGGWVGSDGLYGVRPIERALDSVYIWSLLKTDWPPTVQWWPVASDGFGNYYVVMVGPGVGEYAPIGFIDAAESLEEVSVIVASSLWSFLFFYISEHLAPVHQGSVWDAVTLGENVGIGRWPTDDSWVYRIDPGLRLIRRRYAIEKK